MPNTDFKAWKEMQEAVQQEIDGIREQAAMEITNDIAENENKIVSTLESVDFQHSRLPQEVLDRNFNENHSCGELQYATKAMIRTITRNPLDVQFDIREIDNKILQLANIFREAVSYGEVNTVYTSMSALDRSIKIRMGIPKNNIESRKMYVKENAKYLDLWIELCTYSRDIENIEDTIRVDKQFLDETQSNYINEKSEAEDDEVDSEKDRESQEELLENRLDEVLKGFQKKKIDITESTFTSLKLKFDMIRAKVQNLPIPTNPNQSDQFIKEEVDVLAEFADYDIELAKTKKEIDDISERIRNIDITLECVRTRKVSIKNTSIVFVEFMNLLDNNICTSELTEIIYTFLHKMVYINIKALRYSKEILNEVAVQKKMIHQEDNYKTLKDYFAEHQADLFEKASSEITNNNSENENRIFSVLNSVDFKNSKLPQNNLDEINFYKELQLSKEVLIRGISDSFFDTNFDISVLDKRIMELALMFREAVSDGNVFGALASKKALLLAINSIRIGVPKDNPELYVSKNAELLDIWISVCLFAIIVDLIAERVLEDRQELDDAQSCYSNSISEFMKAIKNDPDYALAFENLCSDKSSEDLHRLERIVSNTILEQYVNRILIELKKNRLFFVYLSRISALSKLDYFIEEIQNFSVVTDTGSMKSLEDKTCILYEEFDSVMIELCKLFDAVDSIDLYQFDDVPRAIECIHIAWHNLLMFGEFVDANCKMPKTLLVLFDNLLQEWNGSDVVIDDILKVTEDIKAYNNKIEEACHSEHDINVLEIFINFIEQRMISEDVLTEEQNEYILELISLGLELVKIKIE